MKKHSIALAAAVAIITAAAAPAQASNTMASDYLAFRAKLATASENGAKYERRDSQLAEIISKIAASVEELKGRQQAELQELRSAVERMQTKAARPGQGAGLETRGDGERFAPPTEQERKAFGQFLRTGDRQAAIEARAAISAGTSGQGLEAVAPWFDPVVREMARNMVPLLRLVTTTPVGNFPAKHIVPTRGVGFGWAGEQGSRDVSDVWGPKVVDIAPGEFFARPEITEWALTDLAFDVEGWLRREVANTYAESLQAAIVAGNGVNKPFGFLAGPTPVTTTDGSRAFGTLQYLPTGQAATLPTTTSGVVDLLLDVVHGLRWAHRANASWVMSATTMSTLRKFKDADGRPILLDSMVSGQPAQLLGYPLIECEAMPSIAANAFPIAFGNFGAGYMLDVDSGGLRVTRDEITKPGFVRYYTRQRVGGKILDSEAIKLLKISTT